MTSDAFHDLEKRISLKRLTTEQEFLNTLKLDKAILYLSVDWSGQERISRHVTDKALSELDKNETPVFQIDCSDQTKQYVINWLSEQGEDEKQLYYGGYGETILINKGVIIDYIKYPGQLGPDKLREKLAEWKYSR